MPNSPEVEHLRRAVEAVKRGLLPEKQQEPAKEQLAQDEAESDEEREDKK